MDLDTLPLSTQRGEAAIPESTKPSRPLDPIRHTAVVSSAIISTPEPSQVISTLIDSLSALSAAAGEGLNEEAEAHGAAHLALDSSSSPRPSSDDADKPDRRLCDNAVRPEESSDGEGAAPPVIRYARSPPVLPKRSSKSRLRLSSDAMWSRHSIRPRDSQQSIRSHDTTESVGGPSIGVPSIERRNGSSTSLSFSVISGRSRSLRNASTVESMKEDAGTTRPVPPKRLSSDRRTVDTIGSIDSSGVEKENKIFPTRSTSLDGYYPTTGRVTDSPPGEPRTVSALGRLGKGDLGHHLIPSRRSSLRRSANGSEGRETYRNSMGSQPLRELDIDAELIEGDSSTIRRIRELQEAREMRQKEWRKEARKSERAAKRNSLPSPQASQRRTSYRNSKLSMTEVVLESPEAETPVELSARVMATDLASLPAIIPSGSGVADSPSPSPGTPWSHSSPVHSVPSKPNDTPVRTPSYRLKRSSTSTSAKPESPTSDMKAIFDEVDAFLSAPRLTQKIRHPRTGRTIAFSEVGDPDGFVVLCCVGMGLTRYLTSFYDELARTLRLRLITPDRPGVGESQPLPSSTPLSWVDDVAVICSTLEITRFSLLAHSAGAIYALATALKMPQYVRGRIHLLAPWIPPSQMPKGAGGPDSQPIANLPLSHKILSVLPAQILKVANSRFLSATSASVEVKPLRASKKKKALNLDTMLADNSYHDLADAPFNVVMADEEKEQAQKDTPTKARSVSCYQANNDTLLSQGLIDPGPIQDPKRHMSTLSQHQASSPSPAPSRLSPQARQALYNSTLTHRIWSLATHNANPAADLVVCLERRKTIGFRYAEVTRSVLIHHGTRDTRVPLDNARWLRSVMKRCELRVLDDEGHGLMASATAMSTVLGEIAKEWEEWEKIAKSKEKKRRDEIPSSTRAK